MTIELDRIRGCLLGLALGDAFGAPYEGGLLERALWRCIGTTREGRQRWTDDTQMALDLAESLIERGRVDADDLAHRFAASYRWSRGYGPAAAKVLKRIARGTSWSVANRSVYPDGSYGNGAAMRAPILGVFRAECPSSLSIESDVASEITHAHDLAKQGARLIAHATQQTLCCRSTSEILENVCHEAPAESFQTKLSRCRRWLDAVTKPSAREVRTELGNGMSATDSCVTALYLSQRFRDAEFDELLAFSVECGGDVDTISSMAGALWGARNGAGAPPEARLVRLEEFDRIQATADRLNFARTSDQGR